MDVHLRVRDLIRSADSRPNVLHEAIVDLASSSPIFRVVTTNYDRHLSSFLPAGVDGYALTDKPEDPRWRDHGVVPVGCGTHEQLPGLIRQWADMARMEMLDHDHRIRAIVSGAPPLPPEDESYLEAVVADPEKVGLFTTHARGVEWLRWMSGRRPFKALFDPAASFGRTEHSLRSWFVSHYAVEPDHAEEALGLVARNGGLVNRELWFSIVQSLSLSGQARSEAVKRWIPVLAHTMPPGCNDWLGMLLSGCELPRDRDLAVVLLDRILEPRLAVARFEPGGMEVVAGTEESWIQCVASEWLESSGPSLARDLVPLVDQHLRRFYLLARTLNPTGGEWRLDGQNRAAIESRGDEGRDGGVDSLIDAARDVIESLVAGYARPVSDPALREVAVILLGGNKSPAADTWYDAAGPEAERRLEEWCDDYLAFVPCERDD